MRLGHGKRAVRIGGWRRRVVGEMTEGALSTGVESSRGPSASRRALSSIALISLRRDSLRASVLWCGACVFKKSDRSGVCSLRCLRATSSRPKISHVTGVPACDDDEPSGRGRAASSRVVVTGRPRASRTTMAHTVSCRIEASSDLSASASTLGSASDSLPTVSSTSRHDLPEATRNQILNRRSRADGCQRIAVLSPGSACACLAARGTEVRSPCARPGCPARSEPATPRRRGRPEPSRAPDAPRPTRVRRDRRRRAARAAAPRRRAHRAHAPGHPAGPSRGQAPFRPRQRAPPRRGRWGPDG